MNYTIININANNYLTKKHQTNKIKQTNKNK